MNHVHCPNAADGAAGAVLPQRRRYRSVLSIGAQCLTGVLLKQAGLKLSSGPFDWIFSNLRMICDCIEDDFTAFLDKDQLQAIPPAQRTEPDAQFAHHLLYGRRYGLHALFNHSDPTVPETYAYLERCVERFRAALRSDRPHLLLAICRRDQGGRYAFDRLCRILERYPSIELCAMILSDPGEQRSLDLWEEQGRHRLFHLRLTSLTAGITFADPADDAFLVATLGVMIDLDPDGPAWSADREQGAEFNDHHRDDRHERDEPPLP